MLYQPTTTTEDPDRVRLVWLVQMLVDQCQVFEGINCKSYIDPVTGADMHNQMQVVQTYYEDWTLTGLNVREDHGTDYAIVYEDPAVDSDHDADDALTALSHGLDTVFLSARDCETLVNEKCQGDGKPDLTVNGRGEGAPTIASRFDRLLNAGVPITQRWSIPNTLRVIDKSYAHRDLAVGTLVTTDTQTILNSAFGNPTTPITPTLLFAREESFRVLNLSVAGHEEAIKWSGSELTVDFNADPRTRLQVVAGLNWAPFYFDSDAQQWQSVTLENYWNELESRNGSVLPGDSIEVGAGKVAIVQFYYLSLYRGQDRNVKLDKISMRDTFAPSDPLLEKEVQYAQSGAETFSKQFVNNVVLAKIVSARDIQFYLGALKGKTLGEIGTQNALKSLSTKLAGLELKSIKTQIGYGAGAVLAIATLIIGGVLFDNGTSTKNVGVAIAGAVILSTALFIMQVVLPVLKVVKFIKELRDAVGAVVATATVLASSAEIIGSTKIAGAVALVLELGIIWGVFIQQWASGSAKPGTAAFSRLVVGVITATLVAVLLFVLSLSVAGLILVAILGFVDLLLSLFCKAGVSGACVSIMGTITQGISEFLFSPSSDALIDLEHIGVDGQPDLIKVNKLDFQFKTQTWARAPTTRCETT